MKMMFSFLRLHRAKAMMICGGKHHINFNGMNLWAQCSRSTCHEIGDLLILNHGCAAAVEKNTTLLTMSRLYIS